MMRELDTLVERASLLPGGSQTLFVVLFWRSSDPAAAAARRRCSDVVWPRSFRAVSVNLDEAPKVAEWFDVSTIPMLAVVTDGAILGMEFEFGVEACRRLTDTGYRQYSMMRSMSS